MDRYNLNLRNKNISFINPLVCGRQTCVGGHENKGIRRYWLIHYITSGKGIFKTDGKIYEITEGEMFIIKPDEMFFYQADADLPWSYR